MFIKLFRWNHSRGCFENEELFLLVKQTFTCKIKCVKKINIVGLNMFCYYFDNNSVNYINMLERTIKQNGKCVMKNKIK